MRKKISGLAVAALFLSLSLGASALLAQPKDVPGRPGPATYEEWYGSLSPEKQRTWEAAWREHKDKMQPLRDQMWRKSMEYDALVGNPNVKPEETRALIDEIAGLRTKMRAERQSFHDKMAQDGFKRPWGPGPGHGYGGCDGYGPRHDFKGHRGSKNMGPHGGH